MDKHLGFYTGLTGTVGRMQAAMKAMRGAVSAKEMGFVDAARLNARDVQSLLTRGCFTLEDAA
ncbi:MAG: hypothetical protein CL484_03070 [Acidobacteria bacterium]|nr:hypothetical protein [Acidobacteriota bacterium]